MNEIKLPENKISQEKILEIKAIEQLPHELGESNYINQLPDEINRTDINDLDKKLEKVGGEYIKDLIDNSEHPDTIKKEVFNVRDLGKLNPEEGARQRAEFDNCRAELIRSWEDKHGNPWPRYTEDVYSSNHVQIRKAGNNYDAHHIVPLSMGGKNEVDNITPFHADRHYDSQGVHAPQSPYGELNKILGGKA